LNFSGLFVLKFMHVKGESLENQSQSSLKKCKQIVYVMSRLLPKFENGLFLNFSGLFGLTFMLVKGVFVCFQELCFIIPGGVLPKSNFL